MLRIRLTLPARRDIADLLDWSAEHFGPAGGRRCEALVETALRDIATDPARTGSREEPQLGPGLRIYHLRLSRDRAKAKIWYRAIAEAYSFSTDLSRRRTS